MTAENMFQFMHAYARVRAYACINWRTARNQQGTARNHQILHMPME